MVSEWLWLLCQWQYDELITCYSHTAKVLTVLFLCTSSSCLVVPTPLAATEAWKPRMGGPSESGWSTERMERVSGPDDLGSWHLWALWAGMHAEIWGGRGHSLAVEWWLQVHRSQWWRGGSCIWRPLLSIFSLHRRQHYLGKWWSRACHRRKL